MNLETLLKEKREAIIELAAKHGAYNIRVFGSVARGEADAQSDIDFLVEMESGRSLIHSKSSSYWQSCPLSCR